jgi:hypothetical protein
LNALICVRYFRSLGGSCAGSISANAAEAPAARPRFTDFGQISGALQGRAPMKTSSRLRHRTALTSPGWSAAVKRRGHSRERLSASSAHLPRSGPVDISTPSNTSGRSLRGARAAWSWARKAASQRATTVPAGDSSRTSATAVIDETSPIRRTPAVIKWRLIRVVANALPFSGGGAARLAPRFHAISRLRP